MTQNILIDFDNYKRTWSVKTEMPVEFTLKYSSDVFNPKNHDLISFNESNRKLIVIDKNVYDLYGESLHKYFDTMQLELLLLVLNADEEHKNWENTTTILKFFEDNKILRREPVIAIGGGVLLDIVGFAASIYRRGIPYIKVPTTLLAIVDASVGSKVGINHFDRRNRLGAYYPPLATLIDKKFIGTQSEKEIVHGIAEIFKLALIKNKELFDLMEENAEQLINEKFQFGAVPVRVINLAITGMIEELAPNLWEKKLDRCVDFGHSFSPIIEMKNVQTMAHGEAVVLDCLLSSCLAYVRNYIDRPTLKQIFNTAKKLKLNTYHKDFTDINLLMSALNDTMKHRNGNQYLPVPIQIGNYKMLNDVTQEEILRAVSVFEEI
jgi:3-dehydroquinate synthase